MNLGLWCMIVRRKLAEQFPKAPDFIIFFGKLSFLVSNFRLLVRNLGLLVRKFGLSICNISLKLGKSLSQHLLHNHAWQLDQWLRHLIYLLP